MNLARTSYINARVEPKLKAAANKTLKKVGISASDAITLFLHQVVLHQGLPFEVRVPNAKTIRAIRELKNSKSPKTSLRASTADELFTKILSKK
jgi:DNA-damage-inducible protein J